MSNLTLHLASFTAFLTSKFHHLPMSCFCTRTPWTRAFFPGYGGLRQGGLAVARVLFTICPVYTHLRVNKYGEKFSPYYLLGFLSHPWSTLSMPLSYLFLSQIMSAMVCPAFLYPLLFSEKWLSLRNSLKTWRKNLISERPRKLKTNYNIVSNYKTTVLL